MSEYPDNCLKCGSPSLAEGVYPCFCDDDAALREWRAARKRLADFHASLPERYREYANSAPPLDRRNQEACNAALRLTPGANLYLWGDTGFAKSHLAVHAAARMVREHGVSALFVDEVEYFKRLIEEVRGGRLAPDLRAPQVLVYDDFGKQKPTEFALQSVYHMLEMRWASKKTFIITSNMRPSDAAAVMAEGATPSMVDAIISRVLSGHVYEFHGERDGRDGGAM